MSPGRSSLSRWLRRLNLGIRLWRRDRELWRLKERAERSRMFAELYWDRWTRDERFGKGNPLDQLRAENYELRVRELEAEIEAYGQQREPAPPEHSML